MTYVRGYRYLKCDSFLELVMMLTHWLVVLLG
jgi:hypothetical protein